MLRRSYWTLLNTVQLGCFWGLLALPMPGIAQGNNGAIVSAYELCMSAVDARASEIDSLTWISVDRSMHGNILYLSTQFPLAIDYSAGENTGIISGKPEHGINCNVRAPQVKNGTITHKLMRFDVSEIWSNMSAISDDEIRSQISEIYDELHNRSDYILRPHDQGQTAPELFSSFVHCDDSEVQVVNLQPYGDDGSRGYSLLTVVYNSEMFPNIAELVASHCTQM